jgi:hypothetical protein
VDVIWWDFGSEVGQIRADFCQTLKTNLTRSMTHMGQMTTPKPLISIIWTCQEMMTWMSMELIGSVLLGCHLVGFWLRSWANQS